MDIFSVQKVAQTTMRKYWNSDHLLYIAQVPGINSNTAHVYVDVREDRVRL